MRPLEGLRPASAMARLRSWPWWASTNVTTRQSLAIDTIMFCCAEVWASESRTSAGSAHRRSRVAPWRSSICATLSTRSAAALPACASTRSRPRAPEATAEENRAATTTCRSAVTSDMRFARAKAEFRAPSLSGRRRST